MPAHFDLIITADYPKRTAELRLLDAHGSQLAYRQTDFKTIAVSRRQGLFDLRNYLRHYVEVEKEAASVAEIGVCIAEEVLGEEIFRHLWASKSQRTLRIQLPGATEEENHLAAALARVPWEIARPSANQPTLRERNLLVRVVHDREEPATQPLALAKDEYLRVLIVLAEARGSRPLAARLERRELRKLFETEIYPQRRIVAHILTHGVTRERLQAQIQENGGYHIVHWSGHGHLNLLELAKPGGAKDHLSGEDLLDLFTQAGGFIPYLFFLSACHSGDILRVKDWNDFLAVAQGKEPGTKETDGFREKADIQHDIYNAFTQLALTDKINVQFEYRRRETDQGDLRLKLDPEFIPTEKRSLQQDIGRAGLHISASPSSDFIASLIYTDRKESQETLVSTQDSSGTEDIRDNRHGYDAEGQYLFRGNWLNLIVGGGNYEIDVSRRDIFFGTPETCAANELPPGCSTEPEIRKFPIEQHNVYAYTNLSYPKNLTWTLGLSYDSCDEESIKLNQVNPKFGLQWNIADRLRLRAAFLRTLKRLQVANETIEPTQVAGFNQFVDDFNGTRTEIFGIGLDARLTDTLYGGVEASRRNLVVPFKIRRPDGSTTVSFPDQHDDRYRAYLYWTPYLNWALSAEHLFEGDVTNAQTVETNSVPLAIRYFGTSGAFAEFGTTFVWQDVDQQPAGPLSPKSEDFAVFDTAIGYRLPKRLGIVSLEARNLFDRQFLFQDLSFKTFEQIEISPRFLPDRTILFQVALNF